MRVSSVIKPQIEGERGECNMDKCEAWIFEKMEKEDWVICDDIRAEAKAAGFTRAQLKAARKVLGVEAFHQFDEDGATENWFWKLEV